MVSQQYNWNLRCIPSLLVLAPQAWLPGPSERNHANGLDEEAESFRCSHQDQGPGCAGGRRPSGSQGNLQVATGASALFPREGQSTST